MEKYNLKKDYCIFFSHVHFEKPVYAMGSGLGFTSIIYPYVLGISLESAEQLLLEKYHSAETKVKNVVVRMALNQDINSYCFPKDIAGFSTAIQVNDSSLA